MLSILIPVYNFDITSLVDSLRKELLTLDIIYEICCLDDASTEQAISKKNKEIDAWMHCSYTIQETNQGRSKTRNKLIKMARYDQLIFLDGDVLPERTDFIASYLQALQKHVVVYGGLTYPRNEAYAGSLHWHYGSAREALSFKQRSMGSKIGFSSANFAIKKVCLNKVVFDEDISSYGFEDLVFAKALVDHQWQIAQLDNPVRHMGIVLDNAAFLDKEHESLRTLKGLYDRTLLAGSDVKLIAYYERLKALGLTSLYRSLYRRFKMKLRRNLLSKKPSLLRFDLYRLGYFIDLHG